MMDWTNQHCRFFHRLLAPDALLFTEMITAEALLHGDIERLLGHNPAEYPLALHDSSFSVGQLLEAQAHRSRISLKPVMKSNSFILLQNYIMSSNAVGFEIEIGLGENELNGLVKKPLDVNKLNKISVQLIQLRGRTLSVAAAKFAEQIGAVFMAMSEEKPEGIY